MLAYCDKIAAVIKEALEQPDQDNIIESVGQIQWDLHPTKGFFQSTKKTLVVEDVNGRRYNVVITEQVESDLA